MYLSITNGWLHLCSSTLSRCQSIEYKSLITGFLIPRTDFEYDTLGNISSDKVYIQNKGFTTITQIFDSNVK